MLYTCDYGCEIGRIDAMCDLLCRGGRREAIAVALSWPPEKPRHSYPAVSCRYDLKREFQKTTYTGQTPNRVGRALTPSNKNPLKMWQNTTLSVNEAHSCDIIIHMVLAITQAKKTMFYIPLITLQRKHVVLEMCLCFKVINKSKPTHHQKPKHHLCLKWKMRLSPCTLTPPFLHIR